MVQSELGDPVLYAGSWRLLLTRAGWTTYRLNCFASSPAQRGALFGSVGSLSLPVDRCFYGQWRRFSALLLNAPAGVKRSPRWGFSHFGTGTSPQTGLHCVLMMRRGHRITPPYPSRTWMPPSPCWGFLFPRSCASSIPSSSPLPANLREPAKEREHRHCSPSHSSALSWALWPR